MHSNIWCLPQHTRKWKFVALIWERLGNSVHDTRRKQGLQPRVTAKNVFIFKSTKKLKWGTIVLAIPPRVNGLLQATAFFWWHSISIPNSSQTGADELEVVPNTMAVMCALLLGNYPRTGSPQESWAVGRYARTKSAGMSQPYQQDSMAHYWLASGSLTASPKLEFFSHLTSCRLANIPKRSFAVWNQNSLAPA